MRVSSLLLLIVAVAGCAAAPRQTPPPGEIIPGPILTFRFVRGVGTACPAFAAQNPVRGTFEGDPARSSGVAWLRAPDGRQLTVAWPEGFTVRFEPDAVLLDEMGRPAVRHGEQVELGQVSVDAHAGTPNDPYLAEGILFSGCYPRAN